MKNYKPDKGDVIKVLKCFLDETCGEWDWDDFISVPLKDKYLDSIRERCAGLPEEFPPTKEGCYCNNEGIQVIKEFIKTLEKTEFS